MRRNGDISILLTDKDFQKILSEWKCFSEAKKAQVYRDYEITVEEVETLSQLWSGLDFHQFEHPEAIVENTLNETIWKLAERKITRSKIDAGRKLYENFARVAAILIVPMILYTAYIQFFKVNPAISPSIQQMVTVGSQPGTITHLVLPDGSQVCLNAGSSVSYPNTFSGNTREVSLTGEAYFEVVKNKQVPMIVSVGDIQIKVYGTSFNVNAFSSEKNKIITLVEGSVSLSSSLGKFNGKDEFFIKPGQTVIFNDDSKKMVVQNDDPFYYTAWKDGLLLFRNVTFETMLKTLSKKFNVDIELKDSILALIPMDATFSNESLSEILRLLSLSTPFHYSYDSPRKLPDGTFAKSKIQIERK